MKVADADLEALAGQTIAALRKRRAVLATVESCTGGLIASQLTDIPGASRFFWGGWCVYDNSAKLQLGLPLPILLKHGAVSAEVARLLAELGLDRMGQAIGSAPSQELGILQPMSRMLVVSTTGIAGPTGGTPEKPVGLCHLGLTTGEGSVKNREVRATEPLERTLMKRFFGAQALRLVLEALA